MVIRRPKLLQAGTDELTDTRAIYWDSFGQEGQKSQALGVGLLMLRKLQALRKTISNRKSNFKEKN